MYHCGSRIAPKASLFASATVLRLLCRKMFKLRARGFRATVRILAETGFRVQGLGFRALIHGYTIPDTPWLQSSAQARRGLHPDIRASEAPSSMLLGLCPKAETFRQPENVAAHRAWAGAAVAAPCLQPAVPEQGASSSRPAPRGNACPGAEKRKARCRQVHQPRHRSMMEGRIRDSRQQPDHFYKPEDKFLFQAKHKQGIGTIMRIIQ